MQVSLVLYRDLLKGHLREVIVRSPIRDIIAALQLNESEPMRKAKASKKEESHFVF